jgi:choline dehydrogenase
MSPNHASDTPIPAFANYLPVRIRFGDGVAGQLPDVVRSHGARRVLVLVDAGLVERSPGVAESIAALVDQGFVVRRFVKPPGEPTVEIVDAAAEELRVREPQALVAIGGGSVIDTAKGARVAAQAGVSIKAFLTPGRGFSEPDVPLIAVPTTAGTGSEVSGGAVISDPDQVRKAGFASPLVRPQDALVDPVLTRSSPPATTAYSGIDALAQAIAGMVARTRTPIGDAIALESIRMVGRSLLTAYVDGGNTVARSEMACASLMAGLTMNISDCTAEHSLGQAIGALCGAAHGLTIGLVLAETLERERHHVPAVLGRVSDALGVADDGSADGSRAVRGVRELLAALDFPVLGSLGVGESQLEALTEIAFEDFFHTQSPQPWTQEEIHTAFAAALAVQDRAASPSRA